MKPPSKEKIFICHEKGKEGNLDIRENFLLWREITSLFYQFEDYTSKLNLSKEDKKRLNELTFYLEKIVEHYDFDIPEFSFSILCSIIESIESTSSFYGWSCFKKTLINHFDSDYTGDQKFMKKMKEVYYSIGRCSFSHSAKRLHPFARIGSKANISLRFMKKNQNYDLFGNKHLFQVAVEVITHYFEGKKIN